MTTQNEIHITVTLTESDMEKMIGEKRMASLIEHVVKQHLCDHEYDSDVEAYYAITDKEYDVHFDEMPITVWEPYERMDYDNFADTLRDSLLALMRLVIENFM